VSRVYLYTFYERVWHWVQATVMILLMWTGAEIHHPHQFHLLGFEFSVLLHNFLGFALIGNAILGLLYHLFTEEYLQFIPHPRGFFDLAIRQSKYYLHGIFKGEKHPIDKGPNAKLNPLQKAAYLMILNVLLPLQLISGIMIWGAQRWPELATHLGDLPILGPVHTLIAWFFSAFLIMHIYLATTGHTPTANIKAMVVGWEDIEDEDEALRAYEAVAQKGFGLRRVGMVEPKRKPSMPPKENS
jgi:thiosulfate reductase cytochrome b subunit